MAIGAGVPATRGSNVKGPCSRFDLLKQHAGIDVQAMYPAGAPAKADAWTYDAFLKAAEACHKAGVPFGIGLGTTPDSVDSVGALFDGFGAKLVDEKGKITVKSDAVRQALEYCVKLGRFFPADAPSFDDATNNKLLVGGKTALILNPPSGWAVAKRDAPKVAEQCWSHGMPIGPKGRYTPAIPYFLGIWSFGKNKSAAKSLLRHMSQPPAVAAMVAASQGFDNPVVRQPDQPADLGRGRPAQGHALPLPDPRQPSDRIDRRCPGAGADRRADLRAGHHAEDGRPPHAGRGDGEDARLGRDRARRLHALNSVFPSLCTCNGERVGATAHSVQGKSCTPATDRSVDDGRCRNSERSDSARAGGRSSADAKVGSERKSTIAFFMTLPLIMLIVVLVVYPAFYAMHLVTLNKRMTEFVGLKNFTFLFTRETFWMVVQQSCIFALTAVALQGPARLHRRASRAQRAGQQAAQVARHAADPVGDPGGHVDARLAVAVRSLALGLQLAARPGRHRPGAVDRRPRTGPGSPSSWSISGSARRSS